MVNPKNPCLAEYSLLNMGFYLFNKQHIIALFINCSRKLLSNSPPPRRTQTNAVPSFPNLSSGTHFLTKWMHTITAVKIKTHWTHLSLLYLFLFCRDWMRLNCAYVWSQCAFQHTYIVLFTSRGTENFIAWVTFALCVCVCV